MERTRKAVKQCFNTDYNVIEAIELMYLFHLG